MQSHIDCPGSERSYGYTKDDSGEIWYWSVDNSGGPVEFRDYGYHTDHPYRKTETVPDEVRDHAQTHVDALREQAETPWY